MADQSQLRAPDVYGRTRQMDEKTLAAVAERLEARGRHPFFARTIGEYMDRLALAGPEAVLDLGCGTGVAARAIARRPEVRARSPPSTSAPTSSRRRGASRPRRGWAAGSSSARATRTGSGCRRAASTWW